MSKAVLDAVCARFGDKVLGTHDRCGDETAIIDRSIVREVGRFLKEDPDLRFDMPVDVTCVDYLEYDRSSEEHGHAGPRFEVVYHFYSTSKRHRLRLKVPLTAEDPTTQSLWPVFRGVDWFEREVYDMFGIQFEGHYDLRRILLYPEFVGHPLRKDYPLRGYQPLTPVARLDRDNEDPKLIHQDLNPEAPVE